MGSEPAGTGRGVEEVVMSQPGIDTSGPSPSSGPNHRTRMLTAIGGFAALLLIIGLIVWIGNRDEEITTSSSVPTSTSVATTTGPTTTEPAPTTTTPSSTTVEATSTVPTTTVAATTVPTTVPATTVPPSTIPDPGGDSFVITSTYFPDDPFTMVRATQVDQLSAYDGQVDVGPDGLRCVAIVAESGEGWRESCGNAGQASRFLVLDGIDPWLVEVGTEPGDVTLTRQTPTWTLPTNGCTAPMTSLLAASPTGGPGASAAMTGIVCRPGEAFVSIGSVILQPGPADGGGALFLEGDEGWDTAGFGTSLDCVGWSDGVDRCELYGVELELFEALLPIPPANALPAVADIVGMRDDTVTVAGWVGAETDPAAIDALIVAELTDPEAEVANTITRVNGIGDGGGLNLLIITVPAMDDSILSTTWAVWISAGSPSSVVQAFAWETCARGIDGASGLCI